MLVFKGVQVLCIGKSFFLSTWVQDRWLFSPLPLVLVQIIAPYPTPPNLGVARLAINPLTKRLVIVFSYPGGTAFAPFAWCGLRIIQMETYDFISLVELHAVPKFLSIITPKCLDSLSAAWLSEWFSHPDCWVSYILHAWIELAWKRTDLSQLYHNCIANRHHNQNNATPTNRPTVYYQPKKSSKKMTLQHLQTQKSPPKKSTLLAPFKTTLSQTLPKPTNPSPPFFKLSFPASGRGL